MSQQTEIDLDAPVHPAAMPDLGLGDVFRFAPIIEEIVAAIDGLVGSGGTVTVPVIKFKAAGVHVTMGPIPLVVTK